MSSSRSDRSAFTLFSLLVLLGVGGLAMALFFPAVLKARDAAKRVASVNNLKQLGLGMHNYHDSFGAFPGAGMGMPDRQKLETGSWCFRLLPFIEQDNLFQQDGGKVAVPTLYCTNRRPPQLYDDQPKTDYAGNAGTAEDPEKPEKEDGIFGKKGIRISEITDGTSNTIMLGEKGLRTTDYLTGKGAGDKNSCWTGGVVDALRSSHGDKRPPKRDSADADNERGFGSPHDRVCNFAFCDGSVRSLQYKLDPKVFQLLCSRDDGQAVNPNDF